VAVREGGERFDDLLSIADVERLVCSTAIRHPAFRLVREGSVLRVSDYTEDVPWRPVPFSQTADVGRVAAEWEAGATIVLQALHVNWAPLAAFCRELEEELGHATQANAYYTPRRSQGFAVHHDTHDVFVLQVSGEKRWLVYEPLLELPLKTQRYAKELGEPGAPTHDLKLAAGDVLYLPRGWLHEALTSDLDSLHVTVGVNVYTWLDAVKGAVEALEADVDLRRSVPPDGKGAPALAERLLARLEPEAVAARKRRKLARRGRPLLDDQLAQLRALASLDLETPVERRPGAAQLSDSDDRTTLAFAGKELSFPAHVSAEVAFVAAADGPFRASEIPGPLDSAGRLVLVRRLVREGFLRLESL
jgi:hypothetical protein